MDTLPTYVRDRFAWRRRLSREVRVGSLSLGGRAPIVVQSMCTTPTQDVDATVAQCIQLAEAGCQIVRITAPGVKDAQALRHIRAGLNAAGWRDLPLCADIHFMPKAAMEAIEHVEKVRVNPGNFADKKAFKIIEYSDADYQAELERVAERFRPLVLRAKELGRALRIGVNHGSLSDRVMNRYGDSPAGMVESAMEFIHIAEAEDFRSLVVSMKSSNPKVMVAAYRLLCARLEAHGEAYPLHLGVTEAGGGLDGRVKGAAGIGALLEDGIGDTIRVSLTEDPVAEIPVAKALARRYQPPPFVADGLAWPPQEHLDPLVFRRRVAEIIRLGNQLPVGGGQVPAVLAPAHVTNGASKLPPDLVVDDPYLWGSSAKGPVPRRDQGNRRSSQGGT
ncbi:MAG: 4-hydroxy-3-methylbut-2-en-1-yl diphosphate synthase, partial [Planctomycetota bacterium]